jgi:hypothetical protein
MCEAARLIMNVSYDADTVDSFKIASFSRFTANEIIEAFTAAFFHAFETANQVHGQGNCLLMMVLQYIQPPEYRSFVVRTPATDETTRCFIDCQCERVSVPPVRLIGLASA